jgi:hypothetical protein
VGRGVIPSDISHHHMSRDGRSSNGAASPLPTAATSSSKKTGSYNLRSPEPRPTKSSQLLAKHKEESAKKAAAATARPSSSSGTRSNAANLDRLATPLRPTTPSRSPKLPSTTGGASTPQGTQSEKKSGSNGGRPGSPYSPYLYSRQSAPASTSTSSGSNSHGDGTTTLTSSSPPLPTTWSKKKDAAMSAPHALSSSSATWSGTSGTSTTVADRFAPEHGSKDPLWHPKQSVARLSTNDYSMVKDIRMVQVLIIFQYHTID